MIKKEDVQKLADLSRITLSPSELEKLRGEIDAILAYVGEVQKASGGSERKEVLEEQNVNVFREDENSHESGHFTKELLLVAPGREKNFIKVKKILADK